MSVLEQQDMGRAGANRMVALLAQPLADLSAAAASIADAANGIVSAAEGMGGAATEIAGHLAAQREKREWQSLVFGTASPGQSYTYTVSGVWVWPLSVFCRLTCSGVAGDRSLTLEYQDADGERFLVAGANTTLAAGQQQAFCWQPSAGVGSWPVDDVAVAPLPQQLLPDRYRLVLRLVNGDAADLIDQIKISARFSKDTP